MLKKTKTKKSKDEYSILIMDRATWSSFKEHWPFFEQAYKEKKLGYCIWNPQEDSFETAFPGLLEQIADKRNWNAILIDLPFLKKESKALTRANQANPFDLMEEWFEEKEAQYPLIRAAHMLGGFPGVEYKPVKNSRSKSGMDLDSFEDKEEAFKNLEEKYMFDGFKPKSVFFVSGRINFDARKVRIQKSFLKPVEKLDFYTRNAYPEKIRFLLYDFTMQGNLKRAAECMEFWLFIHTLALSRELSSYFERYRLYQFKTNMDIDKLEEFLQEKSDQLRASKAYLIRENQNRQLSSKESLQLEQHIAIKTDLPESPGFSIPNNWFFEPVPFLSNSIGQDLEIWHKDMDNMERNFSSYEHALDEEKDQRVEISREKARNLDGEVIPLSKRQKNDIEGQQNKAYQQIYQIKNNLARDLRSLNEQIREKNQEVQDLLKHQRITGSGAMELCLFVLIASIVCFVPAFFFSQKESLPVGFSWASLLFYEMLGVFTIVLVYVLIQRIRLKIAVNTMNELIDSKAEAINRYNDHLGEYLSSLTTYTKCSNYLREAEKKEKEASSFTKVNRQINQIDQFLKELEGWAKANHLHLDQSDEEPVVYYMNNEFLMNQTSAYTAFEAYSKGKSEINETGTLIENDYPFIEGLQIEQEDLHAA